MAWQPPVALLDHPAWTDREGRPVVLPQLPPDQTETWDVVLTPATDAAGWCYATVFQ